MSAHNEMQLNRIINNIQFGLIANVRMYRESQISFEKSNLGLYLPNNPLEWLFQKMILKNPQSLCIWGILEKFENSQKIQFLFMKLVKISDDFKETVRARKNS